MSFEELVSELNATRVPASVLAARLRNLDGSSFSPPPRVAYNLLCLAASDPAAPRDLLLTLLKVGFERGADGWATRDPSLRRLRQSHPTDFWAIFRRGVSDDVLARLDAIGPAGAVRLRQAGVATAFELLMQGSTVAGRRGLAAGTGLAAVSLEQWAHLAELAVLYERGCFAPRPDPEPPTSTKKGKPATPAVEPACVPVAAADVPKPKDAADLANLLDAAGIHTKADLAKWHDTPDDLHTLLAWVDGQEHILAVEPDKQAVKRVLAAAHAEVSRKFVRVEPEPAAPPAAEPSDGGDEDEKTKGKKGAEEGAAGED
jgi:hypothetical protein